MPRRKQRVRRGGASKIKVYRGNVFMHSKSAASAKKLARLVSERAPSSVGLTAPKLSSESAARKQKMV